MDRQLTQLRAARQGMATPEMEQVAAAEGIPLARLQKDMAEGRTVIPANRLRTNRENRGIGAGLRTKINVNLGVSGDCANWDQELEKAAISHANGADAIMDLSLSPVSRRFRAKLASACPLVLGSVPVYDAPHLFAREFETLTVDQLFETVETHAQDGVDFMTIHAGLTRTCMDRLAVCDRITHVVSRGGALLLSWMQANDRENPFFEHFDRLLELCLRYDITISLGDGLRPGSLHDATDGPQLQELILLGELTKRAWKADVQVMIEGPGHVPLHEVAANIQVAKKLTHGAPLYVLGPLVTDVAPGYDHITAAIGGAIAASAGADFLCYVTPAEHLRLPDLDDVREGIMASRIAAHAGDIAKGIPGAIEWDHAMSRARGDLDWKGMIRQALDPHKAQRYRDSSKPTDPDVCTMCGSLCAVKRSRAAMKALTRK
ncbi:MAG: phosphomethylpyrimidine synthase ThiC [Kiritimatiellia bacterium]